jgi:hypothetical protein
MEEKNEGVWVMFSLAPNQNPKTQVWDVKTKDESIPLGQIKWFGRWRKYAFFPFEDTVYENICLRDIAEFIERLMNERHKNI